MVLEAVNENRTACFGWALEQALNDDAVHLLSKEGDCRHHHPHRRSLLRPCPVSPTSSESRLRDPTGAKSSSEELTSGERPWLWCPTWYELRTHYFKEIGFLASFSQLLGATVFWIAGIAALPPVYQRLHGASLDGVYWSPQVSPGPIPNTGLVLMLRGREGSRGHWVHNLQLSHHAGGAGPVVHAEPEIIGVAHRLLEPRGSRRLHALWRAWVRG